MSSRLESLDARRDPFRDDLHPLPLPGEFINTGGSHRRLSSVVHTRTRSQPATDLSPPHSTRPLGFISKLPPAVASVPPDDLRSYVHQKRVGNYLLSKTLGEGSFAKVREGLNALVGEKVSVSNVTS